jgi:putative ABC transport system permease protein
MLEVREQSRLSFRRMLAVCLESVAHRLARSSLTVAIVLLAIAFLAFSLVEGQLGRAARDTIRDRVQRANAYARFLREASSLETEENTVRAAAALEAGGAGWENLRAWGGLTDGEAHRFIAHSRAVVRYLEFFAGLPVGRRTLLTEDRAGLTVFDLLASADGRRNFAERLARMPSIRFPGGAPSFDEVLDGWPAYRERLGAVRRGREETLRAVAEFAGPGGLGARLAAAVRGGDAEFFGQMARRGLRVEPAEEAAIVAGHARQARVERATEWVSRAPVRAGWNRRFRERFSPGAALASCARQPGRIGWISDRLRAANAEAGFDAAACLAAARAYAEDKDLAAKERELLARYGTGSGFGSRTVWLIAVSFLVCGVGIANAMLMSVLERFKEIATMKCLGMRNGTLAFLFVTEAALIGLAGGAAGMLVGFAIAFVRAGVRYGAFAFERAPWTALGDAAGFCIGCSLLLATAAALYPARVASRMAPMEAMRVD